MLALDSVDMCEEPKILKYMKIDNLNINIFRQQNSILFPVIYPETFYRNIISSKETSAFLGIFLLITNGRSVGYLDAVLNSIKITV